MNVKIEGSNGTFVFFSRHSFSLLLLRCLHKQRENGPQTENINELSAVFFSLFATERVIQHFQRSISRHFLLPVKKKSNQIERVNKSKID